MANFTALFDACVLYPAPLRDFLMHLATSGLFRAKWTDEIHEEWIGNLLKNRPDLDRAKLERTRDLMNQAVLDCLVTDYHDLTAGLTLPDPKDAHVVAAAIKCGADTIVTFNTKDFPVAVLAQYDLEAQHPDDFVLLQIGLSEAAVYAAAKNHRASLTRKPKTVDEYLITLEQQGLSQTAAKLREFAALI